MPRGPRHLSVLLRVNPAFDLIQTVVAYATSIQPIQTVSLLRPGAVLDPRTVKFHCQSDVHPRQRRLLYPSLISSCSAKFLSACCSTVIHHILKLRLAPVHLQAAVSHYIDPCELFEIRES
jgi:hypothetical protein